MLKDKEGVKSDNHAADYIVQNSDPMVVDSKQSHRKKKEQPDVRRKIDVGKSGPM